MSPSGAASDSGPSEWPRHTEIAVTRNDTGIVLDFPLRDDPRTRGKKRAWLIFQVGLFLACSAILWFAAAHRLRSPEYAEWAAVPFALGIILFVMAAHVSSRSLGSTEYDDDVRQLAVAGNLLVRTTRDLRKQIWYRHEIRSIQVEDAVMVVLVNGAKARLAEADGGQSELEWIATHLRQAMDPEATGAAERLAHAIQVRDPAADDQRFKRE